MFRHRLATIQLATRTEVFILDMIAILDNVDDDLLQKFGKEVFSNPTVLKLGYSCEGDFQIMMTSCPQWKDALTNVKRFVDVCPLSKQVDPYHTLFGLAGLSLLGSDKVKQINPVYCLPQHVVARLKSQPELLE
ncbi:Geranylgeranyl transferase type-2 subunit beta [Exaiptasia diaphana]|nr:Geranylgeranyl transferase type-2 subunit beta [Exaiptasia diaphana]